MILREICFRSCQLMQEFSDKLTQMRQLLQECTPCGSQLIGWWAHQQSNCWRNLLNNQTNKSHKDSARLTI